jgi:hypothetical protein
MDEDLMYSNRYIVDPNQSAGYGMTGELRQEKLRDHALQLLPEAPRERILVDSDILKTNPVLDDDGQLKELGKRTILKEKRSVITIDSNQRVFFDEKELILDDVTTYESFFDVSAFEIFSKNWARLIGAEEPLLTYAEYALDNNISINIVGENDDNCRSFMRDLIFDRNCDIPAENADVNADLMDLLIKIADVNTLSGDLSIINSLNAYTMAAASKDPTHFWRPFFWDPAAGTSGKPKMLIYKEPRPNSYRVVLPRIINHVKSIRLLSTEIPNTINNISESNNIITLYLRYKTSDPVGRAVQLDPAKSLFKFILIKLSVGSYDIDTLLTHMETLLNDTVKDVTCPKFAKMFKVTWKPATGVIEITCLIKEIEFHLKFYSRLRDVNEIVAEGGDIAKIYGIISDYSHDLWYTLGFPWPYEIDTDTTDKYTQLMTNVVSFGLHPTFAEDHPNDDIFNRTQEPVEYPAISQPANYLVPNTKYDIIHTIRPYRYPSIVFKYIYLVLNGYKSMDHVNQHNGVINFTEHDFFAKILLNVDTGKVAYNSFVSNPLIYPNVIDKISLFDIRWVDERGKLVDFGKVEHSFTLEIISYITQTDVNHYNTKLGTIDQKSYPDFLAGTQTPNNPIKLGPDST